jgi:CheY-like chemotaxis protein
MADASKPVTILIVEDEALVASLIMELLGEMGFEVTGIAASGPGALALARDNPPRLALIDIRLAGPLDGIELACRLRQEFAIPAIFLSGMIDPETALRAQAAQPLALMQKPLRPSEVFNAIERAIAVIS